ncbi:MAG: CDP-glucose 4,6-dehydratase, partial [Stellaceae bacterium]
IGGGDWAEDRIVPDIVRAFAAGRAIQLRQPAAVRPWQHVLEPLRGYLMLAERLATEPEAAPTAINLGPEPTSLVTVAALAESLARKLGADAAWEAMPGDHPPEAATLTLDSGLAHRSLGWRPALSVEDTIAWTADWYRAWRDGAAARGLCLDQIRRYEALCARGSAS